MPVYHRPTWGNGISMQVSNFRSAHTHIQSHTYKHTRWHVAIVVPSHLLLSLSLTQREQSLYLSTDQVGSLSRRRTATVQLIIGAKQGGTGLLKSSHIKRILLFLPLSPPPTVPLPLILPPWSADLWFSLTCESGERWPAAVAAGCVPQPLYWLLLPRPGLSAKPSKSLVRVRVRHP